MIGHVSAAHRPCNQPHPVLLDHVHGHGRVPAYRHAKCRDVSPRCPCKSNEHEPPVLVQGRYDLLGSITHTVKGFRTYTMVGLVISAMREWPGSPSERSHRPNYMMHPFLVGNLSNDRFNMSSILETDIPWQQAEFQVGSFAKQDGCQGSRFSLGKCDWLCGGR